jgi:hypothetical protein
MHVSANIAVYEPSAALRTVTQAYAGFLLVVLALMPTQVIAYLYFFQDPTLKFEDHLFHRDCRRDPRRAVEAASASHYCGARQFY